jgi:hypothetical protein
MSPVAALLARLLSTAVWRISLLDGTVKLRLDHWSYDKLSRYRVDSFYLVIADTQVD